MEKRTCRICLVENVRMYKVVNKNLQEFYMKLADIPFVTEDCTPILVCFFCDAKLKQCSQLITKCLESEEVFAQRLNEDYEQKPIISPGQFNRTAIEHISIVDVTPVECKVIKEKQPADSEIQDDIELKEEHQSDGAPVAEKPERDARRAKQGDTTEQKENVITDSRFFYTSNNLTSESVTESETTISNIVTKSVKSHINKEKELHKCDICQRGFIHKNRLKYHIRVHTGEKLYKCHMCPRRYIQKGSLNQHIRTQHPVENAYKCDVYANVNGVLQMLGHTYF